MSISPPHLPSQRKMRILWIVMGALLLVSVLPLWLYHRQVLRMSEDKLQDTERVQQSEITRSLASEMHAGFVALRRACPTNWRRDPKPVELSTEHTGEIQPGLADQPVITRSTRACGCSKSSSWF